MQGRSMSAREGPLSEDAPGVETMLPGKLVHVVIFH